MRYVYMALTRDEYQLPYAMADSAKELALMLGVNVDSIYSIASKAKSGLIKNPGYIRVNVDDMEDS